jgi:hypothetical protein
MALGYEDSNVARIYRKISDDSWTQIGNDINGEVNTKFGSSLSLSGDGTIVAIGAIHATSNTGYVRVLQWGGSEWSSMGVNIDGETTSEYFGTSVSLSSDGTVLAIGAINAVRVYQWGDNNWTQLGDDIDGEAPGDKFGSSVSLSGDGTIVAIGAPFYDGTGINVGRVRVYQFSDSAWGQMGENIDGEEYNGQLGTSVSLSSDGTVVAIGTIGYFVPCREYDYDDCVSYDVDSYTRVLEWSGSVWDQMGENIHEESKGDQTGYSVSLSSDGMIVVVGAPRNNQFRVLQWNSNSWTQLGATIANSNYYLGEVVALSGDSQTLAVLDRVGFPSVFQVFTNPDLCEDIACGDNMECEPITGSCECKEGYWPSTDGNCLSWTTCTENQVTLTPGSTTTDRVCECDTGYWLSDSVCDSYTLCTTDQYEVSEGSSTEDRVCQLLSICDPNEEYEVSEGSSTEDRVCCGISEVYINGECDCGDNTVDECGLCGGNGIPTGECDCGGNIDDECGLCGGSGIHTGECDCGGNTLDECGLCGGSGIHAGECDCDGNFDDECGLCGGSGIPTGECDCGGNTVDECGLCGGSGIPAGECDCNKNVNDACDVCGGDSTTCHRTWNMVYCMSHKFSE